MKKILIIQSGFLGDVVLSTPVIRAAKSLYPNSLIWFLTTPQAAPLVRSHPDLAGTIIFDKRGARRGIRGFFEMAKEIKSHNFDVAFSLHKSLRTALVLFFARIPIRYGFQEAAGTFFYSKVVPRSDQSHDVLKNLSIFRAIGREPETLRFPLSVNVSEEATAQAQKLMAREPGTFRLGIAPGSVWATKRWTREGFSLVSKHFTEKGVEVVLIGGPTDREAADEIARASAPTKVRNLCGEIPLDVSAAVVSMCDLFLSNDSAPLHLASAFKIPTVALFCATVPEFGFGPWENISEVLGVDGLECRPCGRHGGDICPTGTHLCQLDLLPVRVISALERLRQESMQ